MAVKKKKKKTCSQERNRTKRGQFPKGVSGNPGGRPLNEWRTALDDAIRQVQKKKRKKLMVHAVEQAYKDNTVLVAILKKLLPDLKASELEINADNNMQTFIDWLTGRDGEDSKN